MDVPGHACGELRWPLSILFRGFCVNYDRTRHYGIDPRILAVREGVRAVAAETKNREDQDLFLDMARAWTNIALVEGDVSKLAPKELSKLRRPN